MKAIIACKLSCLQHPTLEYMDDMPTADRIKTKDEISETILSNLFLEPIQSDAVLAKYPQIYAVILEPMLCSALQHQVYRENINLT
jgi:hypothetical protein